MTFPSIAALSNFKGLEREHLVQIEEALGDALHSSKLVAQTNGLDPHGLKGALVTILLALAAKEAVSVAQNNAEPFELDIFLHAARDAARWVKDRNERVFSLH